MDVLLSELQRIHRQVRRRFIPWTDRGEQWTMPPPGYDGYQPLRDDCDGFCLAVRMLLRRAGIRSRLVYCEVGREGHLVVEVEGWILDYLLPQVVANNELIHYRWRRISGFEPGEPWREILGLTA